MRRATNLAAATIPVERIAGPVMLISGDDDLLWPSSSITTAISRRLAAHHHPFRDSWLRYGAAGHAIGEPFYVATDSTLAHLPHYDLALGGTPAANAAAPEDAWPRMIAFLRGALRGLWLRRGAAFQRVIGTSL